MESWIKETLDQLGVFGVGVLMLIENIFPPIPSEVVMPWAGYSVSQGNSSFIGVVVAGSIGSFIGAAVWYYLARWIGKERLAGWVERHGAWLTISPKDLDSVDAWFERWGAAAVLGCRLIPGLRTLISVPAGFADMPQGRFLLYTAIGTVIWTAALAGLGWWLGDNYGDLAGPLGWVSTAVVAGLLLIWLWRLVGQHAGRKSTN
ncbi:DedA family protein [Roseimaritima ulvae]|uniref:Inner membrane protein YqjA n=1 Tax=Roseimaritima ulvae TaxID=980254 RepID=A0A5B9R8Y0_9BACT|nr:DedA family protein [Roseimaritima ulvae]QEG43163.1 Inner membrane protein YqjA [Roseimaritima ulvae]